MSLAASTPPVHRAGLQAVLFDMDGLLIDSEPLWFEVERSIMAELGGEWGPADQLALVGGSLARSVDYLLSRALRPVPPGEIGRRMIDGMAQMLRERGVALLPGARDLLAEVASAGIPRALVTSAERKIMEVALPSIGADFDVLVCAEDVQSPKPDPEPYLRAAALLGAEPAHCVVLEDSPNGVAAGEAAGCLVVAVPGLIPIPTRPGRVVAGSLAQVDLGMLRAMVSGA